MYINLSIYIIIPYTIYISHKYSMVLYLKISISTVFNKMALEKKKARKEIAGPKMDEGLRK